MNVEDFKKMTSHDQLFYVLMQEDGDSFRPYLNIECLTGQEWAMWITADADRIKECPLEKLEHQDWAHVLSKRPELVFEFLKHSHWKDLDGSDWVKILSNQPELAKYCDWSKLHFPEWKSLFTFTLQFAEKCTWSSFEMVQTDELLRLYPELASYAGINDPYVIYTLNNEPIDEKCDAVTQSMLPDEDIVPIFAVMAFVLQRFFDYSADDAKQKTREIYRNHRTLIAVHAQDFAKLRWGVLYKCLQNGGLPLNCTVEPYTENRLKLEMRG